MMMSAMMAAGRMQRTQAEGPLLRPRGTVLSAAAAQRHQQTSQRHVASSKISFFVLLNQSDAMLQRDLHLEKALDYSAELWPSYLRIFSFLRMCGTSSNSREFSRCTPAASSLVIEVGASRLRGGYCVSCPAQSRLDSCVTPA